MKVHPPRCPRNNLSGKESYMTNYVQRARNGSTVSNISMGYDEHSDKDVCSITVTYSKDGVNVEAVITVDFLAGKVQNDAVSALNASKEKGSFALSAMAEDIR